MPKSSNRRSGSSKATARAQTRARQQARSQTVKDGNRPSVPGAVHVEGPEHRLTGMFAVLDDVVATSLHVAATTPFVMTDAARLDLAVLNRAINILEASRILLASAHWEAASSQARQLFELLVNLEYIDAQPNSEDARFTYAKYGFMQFAERSRRNIEYDRTTGRAVDESYAQGVALILASPDLEEFKDRKGKWRSSWCGKNAKTLAEMSSNPIRLRQYEILFSAWSEETHASPGALIEGMFGNKGMNWVERAVADDDRETGQIVLLLITLFLELCSVLPKVPTPNHSERLCWSTRLGAEISRRGLRPPEADLPGP